MQRPGREVPTTGHEAPGTKRQVLDTNPEITEAVSLLHTHNLQRRYSITTILRVNTVPPLRRRSR